MQFSERLKELRCEKGVTITQVARSCKVSIQCISSLEMGKRNPTGSTIAMLADYFGVSADYLLGRSDDFGYVTVQSSPTVPALSDGERELIECYRSLSEKYRGVALDTMRALSGKSESLADKDRKSVV